MKHFLRTGETLPSRPFCYYMDILRRQTLNNIRKLDERRGILHTRRHIAASPIFKGIPNFKPMRVAMLRATTQEELFALMDEVEKMIGSADSAAV